MNTYPPIIGIRGKKKAGKDYAYGCIFHLLASCQLTVQKRAFADALKDEVAHATGVGKDYIEGHKDNFRLILQGWGTNLRRQLYGNDYWVKRWINFVHNYQAMKPSDIIVATDVRFKNELEAIENMGGTVIQIIAINKPELEELDTHESECELDTVPCKHILQNNFTDKRKLYDSLRAKLKQLNYPII